MNHVFPRHTKSLPPRAVRGEGAYLFDASGKQYLDGSGGAAVSCLGHSDPDVIAAIKAQIDEMAFAHTGFFTSNAAESLADRLIEHAPGDLDRVYFVSGGSEAVEAALKLARQYFLEIGQTQRSRFIARRQSYHGNTLAALATGGNAWRKEPFAPLMIDTSHISPCYEYRERRRRMRAPKITDCGPPMSWNKSCKRVGPENVIAFIAEPVVGATAGAVPPAPGYFKRIREICDQYGDLADPG